jgi:MFS family permease
VKLCKTVIDLQTRLAQRNVALLVLCQALAMTSITMLFTVAALIGERLAQDPALATLPIALLQVAVMLTTIPASLYMQRVGRRRGFLLGTLFGIVGAGLGVAAVLKSSFLLFCLATVLFGIFNGFAGFYRFAAADAATESFRARAISFVVAGGVVAALLGPNLANWTKDWFTTAEFAGSLLPIVGLQIVTLGVLQGIQIPPVPRSAVQSGRPIGVILRQPVFIVATLGSMVGYSVMVLLMTATPLAMTAMPNPGHPFAEAAFVIQWHVLGMFAPSFFTGSLISRFGVLNVILWGIGCNFLSVAINFLGTEVGHFLAALTLLGIGWNFMFVGSTTLLTQIYSPAEKAKTQAAHDFLMFTSVALAAFLSGRLLSRYGWLTVNQVALPGLILALVAVLWLRQQRAAQAESSTL